MSDCNIGTHGEHWAPYCDAIFSEIGFEVEFLAELAVIQFRVPEALEHWLRSLEQRIRAGRSLVRLRLDPRKKGGVHLRRMSSTTRHRSRSLLSRCPRICDHRQQVKAM